MGVINWKEIYRIFDNAYCEAAQAGAEMRPASNAIETLREAINAIQAGKPVVEAWAIFDEQIGRADLNLLMPVLIKLRNKFIEIATQREVYRLRRAFERSDEPERAWQQWTEAYVRAFSPWGWRMRFSYELAKHGLYSYSPSKEWPLLRIREAAKCISKGRWSETYDWFLFLAKQKLPKPLQAEMLAVAASIQVYDFYQPTKMKALLKQVEALDPENVQSMSLWGDYWLQQGEAEKARLYYEKVIQTMPDVPDGYNGMGDYYQKQGEVTRAEDLYHQAIINAAGAMDGYQRLVNFYGSPERFTEHKDLLPPLFKRLFALDEYAAGTHVTNALLYKNLRQYEEAHKILEQAIQADRQSSQAYVWKGYTYVDQLKEAQGKGQTANEFSEQARWCFQKVIEIAPNSIDGYWGMMWLEMALKNWEVALDFCNQCFPLHEEWESFVLTGRADIYQQMGRFEAAEKDLLKSLEIEPENPTALAVLTSLADSYQTSGERELSLRVLDTLYQYKGESYRHTYLNLIGNIFYYFKEFNLAAEQYRQAVAIKGEDDVLHSNLALALEQQKTLGKRQEELEEAIRHLNRARELNPEDKSYTTRLVADQAEYDFLKRYGEKAFKLDPVVSGIEIRVSNNLIDEIVIVNEEKMQLSEETLQAIDKIRQEMKDILGVSIPGILFSYLDESYANSSRYEIYFQEIYHAGDSAEPGKRYAKMREEPLKALVSNAYLYGSWVNLSDEAKNPEMEYLSVVEYILNHLKRLIYQYPNDLLEMDYILERLADCDKATKAEIRKSSVEMVRYAKVLKQLLEMGVPLSNIQEISEKYLQLRQETDIISDLAVRLASPDPSMLPQDPDIRFNHYGNTPTND